MKKLLALCILIFVFDLTAQVRTKIESEKDLTTSATSVEKGFSSPSTGTFNDTSIIQFQSGTATNLDLSSSPGDVLLTRSPDQQQNTTTTSGTGFNTTQWLGQTFVPGVSGNLTRIEMALFCASCSGTDQPITVEVRTTTGSPALPTNTVLATTTIAGFNTGFSLNFSAVFATPPALTAGTTYAYTLRLATNRTGTYAAVFGAAPTDYPNGNRVVSTNSGGTWTVPTSAGTARDLVFRTFMDGSYIASGDLVSNIKDANPAVGETVTWDSLSWNASTPANTSVVFQLAASNNVAGPFNFIGPDGTAATFYTAPSSLGSLFNGNRYLRYRAYLGTTNPAQTPVLNDVTITETTLVAPTAGEVSISGRVTVGARNAGLANASVTLTDAKGISRRVLTSSFGYYTFPNVEAGQVYTIAVESKKYRFAPQIVNVADELTDVNFYSGEARR